MGQRPAMKREPDQLRNPGGLQLVYGEVLGNIGGQTFPDHGGHHQGMNRTGTLEQPAHEFLPLGDQGLKTARTVGSVFQLAVGIESRVVQRGDRDEGHGNRSGVKVDGWWCWRLPGPVFLSQSEPASPSGSRCSQGT